MRVVLLVAALASLSAILASEKNRAAGESDTPVVIRPPIGQQTDAGPVLTLVDASKVTLVNMIPRSLSGETDQDSEPFLAVHPDKHLMVGAAYSVASGTGGSVLYLSADGGWNWALNSAILPLKSAMDPSYSFSGRGRTLYGAALQVGFGSSSGPDLSVSILKTDDPTNGAPMSVISVLRGTRGVDQPFIQTRPFTAKPSAAARAESPSPAPVEFNEDRIYVGQNYFDLAKGQTASVRVSVDSGRTFSLFGVEARTTIGQDAPSVRPAIARDGTVYVAFMRWTAQRGQWSQRDLEITGDVVVVRDDEGAIGTTAFHSLKDADGFPGRRVEQNQVFPFTAYLGQQRIGSQLSLAVDPNNSAAVYVAWAAKDETSPYTIHVRRSVDRGQTWSPDVMTVPSGTNPALAVADDGSVGFLYQQLVEAGQTAERWETHFRRSPDGLTAWADMTLTTFPAAVPVKRFDPYLGDKIHLLALGGDFYGVFSAPNTPDPKHFPQGVRFQRRHRVDTRRLLQVDGVTPVPISIDPYFLHVPARIGVASMAPADERPIPTRVAAWIILLVGALGAAGLTTAILFVRRRVPRDIAGAVDRVLTERIHGPALTNYRGFVAATLVEERGADDRRGRVVGPGARCTLTVIFSAREGNGEWEEAIDIHGGEDAPEVVFRLSVDAGDVPEVRPTSATVTTRTGDRSQAPPIQIVAPASPGDYPLFVQVFQKTRLVQVLAVTLRVRADRDP